VKSSTVAVIRCSRRQDGEGAAQRARQFESHAGLAALPSNRRSKPQSVCLRRGKWNINRHQNTACAHDVVTPLGGMKVV
jgi:hypothetical protein